MSASYLILRYIKCELNFRILLIFSINSNIQRQYLSILILRKLRCAIKVNDKTLKWIENYEQISSNEAL